MSSFDQSSSYVDETKDEKENEGTEIPVFRLQHDMRPLEEQKKSADEEIAKIQDELNHIDGVLNTMIKSYENEKIDVRRTYTNFDDIYPDFEREPEKYKNVQHLKNLVDYRVKIINLETQKAEQQQNLLIAKQNREDLNATPYDALQLIKKLKDDQEQTRKEFEDLNITVVGVEKGIEEVKLKMNDYQSQVQKLNETLNEVEREERDTLQNLRKECKELDDLLKQYRSSVA